MTTDILEARLKRSTVALVRCETYDPAAVSAALARGVELLGGLERFVSPGERILFKPNVLAGEDPEKAVTTHPAVLVACIRLFRSAGAVVSFGDSPCVEGPTAGAERAGLYAAGLEAGAAFADFTAGSHMDNVEGGLVDSFPVAQAVHDCDGLVNLPKMKTHGLTRITGAVKNLFGCVPGKRKTLYHVQFRDPTAFSRLLVELAARVRPRLHVMDGVVAMEGNGPRGGDPRPMKVLLLSEDPVAVDATFCRLVAMEPFLVPTNRLGEEHGLGRFAADGIEIVGDDLDPLIDPDFKVVRKPVYSNASLAHFNLIKNLLLPRPVIDEESCVRCGQCVEACPVPGKAVQFEDGGNRDSPPAYDYDRCIRCYCCHETCPHRAIDKQTPLLGRLFNLG